MEKKHFCSGKYRGYHRISGLARYLLPAVFVAFVFVPLGCMFASMDRNSIREVVHGANFRTVITHSLTVATVTTILSVATALLLALATERCAIPGKAAFGVIITMPMLIPSISCGMGLIALFGNNGFLTRLLGLNFTIYGFWGIVLGSVIFSLPVAYLILADVFRYEDMTPYEAARLLGIPVYRQFLDITLPYLSKPLIRAAFSVFTLVITDYGVPIMVGGKYTTLPVVMYQEVIGQLDFGRGAVYGSLLLLPAILTCVIDLLYKDSGGNQTVTRREIQPDPWQKKTVCCLLCTVVSAVVLLPILSFGGLAFWEAHETGIRLTAKHIGKAFRLRAGNYWVNAVAVAGSAALLGTVLAFVCGYFSARTNLAQGKFLHLSAMTSAAIPGLVLGLSYVIAFRRTSLYGTMLSLVVVNLFHFVSSPYLMCVNCLSKINKNLESVADTLCIERKYLMRDVILPQCSGTLVEMFSYFFVNCMMTISAVSFLANAKTRTISLMINQFEAQSQLECAAVVSLMILGTNLVMKMTARHFGKLRMEFSRWE